MPKCQNPMSQALARNIAERYSKLSLVEAVALAGSHASETADQGSDLDLYVYSRTEISMAVRAHIAAEGAQHAEVGNQFWESGDEWIDAETGIHVDVTFRIVAWIEEQLDRVLRRYEASVGYSTCLWYNVISSQVLYDRGGWFRALQRAGRQAYPEGLRRAIVAKNLPILRRSLSSYVYQLERAVARSDGVSINHRVAALLASYFDILFAVNRMVHPGEKRLVEIALAQCEKVPEGMGQQVRELIEAVPLGKGVVGKADALIEGLTTLLRAEGLELSELVNGGEAA